MSSKVTILALGAFAIFASAVSLQAQCYESQTGASIGTGDDAVLPIQALGFAFPFGGATYTDVHACTNGFVYLSNASVPVPGTADFTPTLAELVAGSPKICHYWSDLNVVSGTGDVLFNALPGKVVITWHNVVEYGNTEQFSVQLQLMANGDIFFAYDGRCAVRTAGDFIVGMSEGGGAAIPSTSDFSTVNASAATTNFEIFNNVGLPLDLAGQTVQFIAGGLGYTWIPQVCAGGNVSYGSGCYNVSDSFYQLIASPAAASAAMSNTAITMLPVGTGYVVTNGGTFVAPTGAATVLTLIDDGAATTPALTTPFPYPGGTATNLTVCSNGFVSAASGNTTAYVVNLAVMLDSPQAAWWSWHDYNPTAPGSGQVKFEQVGAIAYVTWDGVYNYSGTTAADATTFQFQFDSSNGSVTIAYLSVSANNHTLVAGEPHLVGFSPAGPSSDAGSVNFATGLPVLTSATQQVGLAMSAAGAPISGSPVMFTIDNMPELVPTSGVYVGLHIISLGQVAPPGLDLGFLGAPGCALLLQSLDVTLALVGASPSQTSTLIVPPAPLGTQFFSQGAALFMPNSLPNGQNAFGAETSNAIASTIGLW